jgi:hypothetical protein
MLARPTAIAVLGMHRSGTSCLTGLLEGGGVYLGGVSKWNPHNRKGNQESDEIVQLNNAILAFNGSSWEQPPEQACAWTQEHFTRGMAIVATYQGHEPWAFKDPRTLLTLAGWRELLPGLAMVGTFRHPLAVARSLVARGGIELETGLRLWLSYNRRLLELAEKDAVPLVCFDLPPAAYLDKVHALMSRLGLTPAAGFGFYEDHLRHQRAESATGVSPDCLRLYQAMQDLLAR